MKRNKLMFKITIDRTPADAKVEGHVMAACDLYLKDEKGDEIPFMNRVRAAECGLPTGKRLVENIVRWAKYPSDGNRICASVRKSDVRRVLRLALKGNVISTYSWPVHRIQAAY